jgi:hypothetical protein
LQPSEPVIPLMVIAVSAYLIWKGGGAGSLDLKASEQLAELECFANDLASRDSLQGNKRGKGSMEHLDVDKLRDEFNRASASVRVVSVFSPT